MNLSFLITTHNEDSELEHLLDRTKQFVSTNNVEVVILDDYSLNEKTQEIIQKYISIDSKKYQVYYHHLNKNFGEHKQYGSSKCKGDYIWQLDADEYPSEFLLENIFSILESNPSIEFYQFPRINLLYNLNKEQHELWGWEVRKSPFIISVEKSFFNESQYSYIKENNLILKETDSHIEYFSPLINWGHGDYQGRLYKNTPSITWTRPLHEHIVGYSTYCKLPHEFDFGIFHPKTLDKQIKQNLFYNENFSFELNSRIY